MKKTAVILLLAVVCAAGVFRGAFAQTTAEKEELYSAAILQLESYLDGMTDDVSELDGMLDVLNDLRGYKQSKGFSHYVTLLKKIALDEYDFQFAAETRLLGNESFAGFRDYLEELLKDSSVRSVNDLLSYAEGRRLEHDGEAEKAIDAYARCLNFFDADRRYQALQLAVFGERYDRAVALMGKAEPTMAELVSAYVAFAEMGVYEASAEYAEIIAETLGYRPESADDLLLPVRDLQLTAGPTEVTLSWTPSDHAAYYTVTCAPEEDPDAVTVFDMMGDTGVIPALEPGTRYRFTVVAHSGAFVSSPVSVSGETASLVTPVPKPTDVTGLRVGGSEQTSVTLVWEPQRTAEYYSVYQRRENTDVWSLKVERAEKDTCTVTGLIPGAVYDFRVVSHAYQQASEGALLTGVRTEPKTVEAGDSVLFGRYEQDNNDENGAEPIEWLVLKAEGRRALLISRYGLDAKPYHQQFYQSITWEGCTLREWLNGEFMSAAFTTEEQHAILMTDVDNSQDQGYRSWRSQGGNDTQDRLYLLSYAEAGEYFSGDRDRMCAPTDLAVAHGASTTKGLARGGRFTGWWWLRSPGDGQRTAAAVNGGGSRSLYDVNYGIVCVRPVMWVDLDAGDFPGVK